MIVSVVSCESKPDNTAVVPPVRRWGPAVQRRRRPSRPPQKPDAAFHEAAKSGDQAALLAIFGPDAKEVLFSGDPVKDKNALQAVRRPHTKR